MATIEELEQKIRQLEKLVYQEKEQETLLTEKAEKAIDTAMNCYKVDHYGYIWAYDAETKKYRKTKMRVMTPEVANRAIESRHLADNAIEGRHLQDDIIEGRMIKNKTIDGRSLMDYIISGSMIVDNTIEGRSFKDYTIEGRSLLDDIIGSEKLKDESVPGTKLQQFAVGIEHLVPGTIDPTKILLSDVALVIDENNGDIQVIFYNDCGVEDAYMDDANGDIILAINDEVV